MSVVDIVHVIERGQDLYKWLREKDSRNIQRRLGRSHLPGLTRPEHYAPTNALSATYFYGNANLVLLQEMLRAGTARFGGVGLTFNLLNHRAEILTRLLDNPRRGREVAKPWSMVPPGASALILGVRRACRDLGREEPEWLRPSSVAPGRGWVA